MKSTAIPPQVSNIQIMAIPLSKDTFLAYNYRMSREAGFLTLSRDYSLVKKIS